MTFRTCLLSLCVVALTLLLVPAGALAGASDDYLVVYKSYQKAGVVDGCAFSAKQLASAKKGVPPDIDTYAPDFPEALDAALRQRAGGGCDTKGSSGGKGAAASGTAAAGAASAGSSGGGNAAAAGPGLGTGSSQVASGLPAAELPGAAAGAPAAGATGTPGLTPAPAPEAVAAPAASDGRIDAAATRRTGSTEADGAPLPLVLLAALAILAALAALVWALVRFFGVDPPWLVSSRHATAEAGWRTSASWAEFGDWLRFGR